MATRGITQLLKLKLFYCEVGGSSRAMRAFIASQPPALHLQGTKEAEYKQPNLIDWATEHPDIQVEVIRRSGKHPMVQGIYLTQGQGTDHQVGLKNVEIEVIKEACDMLANRSGRKIQKLVQPVLTDTPSCQGIWTPFLNLYQEPAFSVQLVPSEQSGAATSERNQVSSD